MVLIYQFSSGNGVWHGCHMNCSYTIWCNSILGHPFVRVYNPSLGLLERQTYEMPCFYFYIHSHFFYYYSLQLHYLLHEVIFFCLAVLAKFVLWFKSLKWKGWKTVPFLPVFHFGHKINLWKYLILLLTFKPFELMSIINIFLWKTLTISEFMLLIIPW